MLETTIYITEPVDPAELRAHLRTVFPDQTESDTVFADDEGSVASLLIPHEGYLCERDAYDEDGYCMTSVKSWAQLNLFTSFDGEESPEIRTVRILNAVNEFLTENGSGMRWLNRHSQIVNDGVDLYDVISFEHDGRTLRAMKHL